MDFNTTIDLIIKDLNEASEIIDDLKKYPGVPALQVELAKSKCRSAGDVIALLKSIADLKPAEDAAINAEQKPHIPDSQMSGEQKEKTSKLSENKKKVSEPEVNISNPVEKKAESQGHLKNTSETPILADKFTSPSDLYTEQSDGIKHEKDLSDHLKSKTIQHLSEAIGISDKFLFIGEIFDGDKEAYAQAISRLDKAESLKDAMAIIMSYTGGNTENEAVSQLLDLVRLKLPSNE